MGTLKIRAKLIILFILIKVIPLLLIAYIAVNGAKKLDSYFSQNTITQFENSKVIVQNTAEMAIDDSIKMLDKKSQISLERISYEIAHNVATFLYERDKDLLFLASIPLNQQVLHNFFETKQRAVTIHPPYRYNQETSTWQAESQNSKIIRKQTTAQLADNGREFHYVDPMRLLQRHLPIYKEVAFFDLKGQEIYKVSQLNSKRLNISEKINTYIRAETYFDKIFTLKKGEIYVSEVIGEYIGSKIIGTFSKEKAENMGIKFEPEKYAYAGKENPVGKRFEGIIRFISPVFSGNKKVGFVSLALDHRHLMEFTDNFNPTSSDIKQDIADASLGNYAFMWDYLGKNISHPRDYFIVGYDSQTGEQVPGWISADLATKFKQSRHTQLNDFLRDYPGYEQQSLNKKPNLEQLEKDGSIALDCRYVNFAPQCQGWMQLTENGGYGSFIIYWSKVWKLTTAATIPYYSGQYKNSKRGFGFVTIGANVDEFHMAANQTRQNVKNILDIQTKDMQSQIRRNQSKTSAYVKEIIHELSVVTFLMLVIVVAIALWMSNYITSKISNLLIGTQKFAQHDFDYQISVNSNDEIGELERSFNNMAHKIQNLMQKKRLLNESLEEKVAERTRLLAMQTKELEAAQIKLKDMAYSDPLTGLYNRRYFEEVAKELLLLARRESESLGVLMIDIDKFKQINDTHGHDVGDQVLIQCARKLQGYIRKSDVIARIGGEEFSIILPKSDQDSVEMLANNIRRNIEALEISVDTGVKIHFTVSIGASMFADEQDHDINDIIKRADEGLYTAKAEGRNKVFLVVADEHSS